MNEKNKNGNSANKARRIDVEKFTMMQVRQRVVEFIKNNPIGVLVVEVPTGGGKTYGLPYIIKRDILLCLSGTRTVVLEVNRAVAQDIRLNLAEDVLQEKVGLRIGRDRGLNYHGERFAVGTTGASFKLVREGEWNIVVLDEFDLDQNGDVAIMQNRLHKMLNEAASVGRRMIVVLPSATPDMVNAKKFYGDLPFPFEVVKVDDRIYNPDILQIDIGSESATSFRNIMDRYVGTVICLCKDGIEQDGKRYQIPRGKNILCTLPSPVYFEEMERKIAAVLDPAFVDVVKVWGKSTDAEKQKLFSGGDKKKTTIFLATDLIRRGGTPEVHAVFPSGWQVRPFCDPASGIEGTREERSSMADYLQDEGRSSRKEKGLVIRSLDSKRPEVGLTFLERSSLEVFLLDLIHHEDISKFKWWGEVSQEKIAWAVENLKRAGAAEEKDGKIILTSLGRAMRGIPGSLAMRSMIFRAHEYGVLEQFIVVSAGLAIGDLFANAKNRPEIGEAQKPLLCNKSDYLSILKVWSKISEMLVVLGVNKAVEKANKSVDQRKAVVQQKILSLKKLNSEEEEALKERIHLIEMERQELVERAIFSLARRGLGEIAFKYGLYGKGLEAFLQNVIKTVTFMNGKKFSFNGKGEQVISLDLMRILTCAFEHAEEKVFEPVHKVLLSGYAAEQLWKNIPHRGSIGYFYKNLASGKGGVGIFPGSATFNSRMEYLIGVPVNLKGNMFLKHVVVLRSDQIGEWLPEVVPQLCISEVDEIKYDSSDDKVYGVLRVKFNREEIAARRIEVTDERAVRAFANYLLGWHGKDSPSFLEAIWEKRVEVDNVHLKSAGVVQKVSGDQLVERFISKLGTACTKKQAEQLNIALTDSDISKIMGIDYPEVRAKVLAENPDSISICGKEYSVRYERDWNDKFKAVVEIESETVFGLKAEDIPKLPSGRNLTVKSAGYEKEDLNTLKTEIEEARLQKSWEGLVKIILPEAVKGDFQEFRFDTNYVTGEPAVGYAVRKNSYYSSGSYDPTKTEVCFTRDKKQAEEIAALTQKVRQLAGIAAELPKLKTQLEEMLINISDSKELVEEEIRQARDLLETASESVLYSGTYIRKDCDPERLQEQILAIREKASQIQALAAARGKAKEAAGKIFTAVKVSVNNFQSLAYEDGFHITRADQESVTEAFRKIEDAWDNRRYEEIEALSKSLYALIKQVNERADEEKREEKKRKKEEEEKERAKKDKSDLVEKLLRGGKIKLGI